MRFVDLVEIKKNKNNLSNEQIHWLIDAYVKDIVKDYQMSSMAMAITINGMSDMEVASLTEAMMNSGDVIDLSLIEGIKVDKHSTGGIGDKTSIVIGPIIASLGVPMAKMSGRGLGFTGGTLDKLESIPKFNVFLTTKEFINQVNTIGLAIIGQSKKLVPADKLLYNLRDVTGTVNSIPLIASSIMSKKLALGSDAILLDIKVGDGAFMKTFDDAKKLAKLMLSIGKAFGRDVKVEITNMNRPLGRAIGNKNEIIEAIETLKGNGTSDFVELVVSSSVACLMLAKKFTDFETAKNAVKKTIATGQAFTKFKEWIVTQNGDIEAILKHDFWKPLHKLEVKSTKNGFMEIKSAIAFGMIAMELGAGRATKEEKIDNEAGIYLNKKTNEKVMSGDVIFTLYSSNIISNSIIDKLKNAYNINDKQVENKIILGRL